MVPANARLVTSKVRSHHRIPVIALTCPTDTVGSAGLRTTRNSSAGRVTNRLPRALSLLAPPGGTQPGCPSGYGSVADRVR
jgi:hypothetical protein